MIWNRDKPYRLNTEQELFRFGYKNNKNKIIFVFVAGFAFCFGGFVELLQRGLLDVLIKI